jgi:hypothetical protein
MTALQDFLRLPEDSGAQIQSRSVRATDRWLSKLARPWLMIIDNADDPNVNVSSYFSSSRGGMILINGRNSKLKALATSDHFELGPLEQDEAIDLLLRVACYEDLENKAARAIASRISAELGR